MFKEMRKMNRKIPILILNQNSTQRCSDVQPLWHFVLLSITTFGLYYIYWFYRNWKYLKAYKGLDISPIKRTVGLFIPIYNFLIVYDQLYEIRDLARDGGVDKLYTPGWIFFGYLIFNAFGILPLPDPYWLLSFLSVVPLAIVQNTLNSYWITRQTGVPKKTAFHLLGEFIVAIVCTILCFSIIDAIF